MTRALVLGGTGFVGAAACKELMRRGVEVVAASRTEHPYGTFTSHVACDRRDEAALARALGSVQPDVLLDLACYQPAEMAAVMRLFRGDRYVFVATGTVLYPEGLDRAASEGDFVPAEGEPPAAELAYVEGKVWCETLLRAAGGFPAVTLRPPNVLGAADPTQRILWYFRQVDSGEAVPVPAETVDSALGIVWSRDLGYACALAADLARPAAGPYNVAWEGISARRLVEVVAAVLGRPARPAEVPFADLPPGASPYGPDPRRARGLDCTRIRDELGWAPSALEEALAEVAAWYRVVSLSSG